MKHVSRVAFASMLVGLMAITASGDASAQETPTHMQGQPQPQVAREVISGWVDAHPLEYYLALPVDVYLTQAQTPNWVNAHPLEYYLAFPVGPQLAEDQNTNAPNVARESGKQCEGC